MRSRTLDAGLYRCRAGIIPDWLNRSAAIVKKLVSERPWDGPNVHARQTSLLSLENSLFFEIFSLLICAGNCVKSHCSTGASYFGIGC